jgi:hypothetical protein
MDFESGSLPPIDLEFSAMVKDASFAECAETRLIEAGLAEPTMIQGCPVEEIARLKKDLGVALPTAYRRFLAQMRRSAGKFLTGTDFLFADLGGLRLQARQLLQPDGRRPQISGPRENSIQHQGEINAQGDWFRLRFA